MNTTSNPLIIERCFYRLNEYEDAIFIYFFVE